MMQRTLLPAQSQNMPQSSLKKVADFQNWMPTLFLVPECRECTTDKHNLKFLIFT